MRWERKNTPLALNYGNLIHVLGVSTVGCSQYTQRKISKLKVRILKRSDGTVKFFITRSSSLALGVANGVFFFRTCCFLSGGVPR